LIPICFRVFCYTVDPAYGCCPIIALAAKAVTIPKGRFKYSLGV
jgi:hypothetical protein